MMPRVYFTPVPGEIYKHQNGSFFKCLSADEIGGTAEMRNLIGRWTITAHGCGIYPDKTIDWDYSTGGHFAASSK